MKMKINSKKFRVRKRQGQPQKVADAGRSRIQIEEQYQKLLGEHVAELSSQQQLLYASNRHAVLLISRRWTPQEKTAHQHVMSGSIRKAAKSSASSIPAPVNCSTTFSGARRGTSGTRTDRIFNRSYYEEF